MQTTSKLGWLLWGQLSVSVENWDTMRAPQRMTKTLQKLKKLSKKLSSLNHQIRVYQKKTSSYWTSTLTRSISNENIKRRLSTSLTVMRFVLNKIKRLWSKADIGDREDEDRIGKIRGEMSDIYDYSLMNLTVGGKEYTHLRQEPDMERLMDTGDDTFFNCFDSRLFL